MAILVPCFINHRSIIPSPCICLVDVVCVHGFQLRDTCVADAPIALNASSRVICDENDDDSVLISSLPLLVLLRFISCLVSLPLPLDDVESVVVVFWFSAPLLGVC